MGIPSLKNAERMSLKGRDLELKFRDTKKNEYTYEIHVDDKIGEGSSCICYLVTVFKGSSARGQKRILKQFYPDPRRNALDITMEGIRLDIKGCSYDKNVQQMGARFEKTYYDQIKLANMLPDVIVQPDLCYFDEDGSTKYILFNSDGGRTPGRDEMEGIEDILHFFYEFALSLEKMHRSGIIHMDLKPENVLWVDKKKVKFFDFDSSVDLEKTAEVRREDIGLDECEDLSAPELRELMAGDQFEQNKKDALTINLDLYAYGAMLFYYLLGEYPNLTACRERNYEERLRKLYNTGRYRGELSESEQRLLNEIIWKCIQYDRGISSTRYGSSEELLADIKELYHRVNVGAEDRRKQYRTINTRFQAGYIMDKYPPAKYRKKTEDGRYVLDILIAGDALISDEFFKNIFSCAQMLDTKLVIRLAGGGNAEERMWEFAKWPLLLKTTKVFVNNREVKEDKTGRAVELQTNITKDAFAELHFDDWNPDEENITEFFERCGINPSWVILADSETERNISYAGGLAQMPGDKCRPAFIGYLDNRGDGYDLRQIENAPEDVVLVPFSDNDKYSLDEKDFEKDIRGKALLLHKYYMREWYERASKKEIWKDFSSSAYNLYSSLCSVLSIPYKLESVGIRETGGEAARRFYNEVLCSTDVSKLNDLIYLEHRRWMCFMVTEGYARPNAGQLQAYAFVGENDQRNKKEKLHPLISDSARDGGVVLDKLPHSKWEDGTLLKGDKYDELDKMSLRIHQICQARAEKMSVEEGSLKNDVDELEKSMCEEGFNKTAFAVLDSIKKLCRKMLDNESNVNAVWEKECARFQEMVNRKHKGGRTDAAFKVLKNSMRVVVERNAYHDYKSSDRTILEALPLLLTSENGIRRIHKPAGQALWQNIMSSLILEPEELILYTDAPENADADSIKAFLTEKRGISVKVTVSSMQEFRNIKIKADSVKSIVDITGLKPEMAFYIAQMANLGSLPVVSYRNGKLLSLKGRSEVDYYKKIRRHLTTAETFSLFNAKVYSDAQQNQMLGLGENYGNIWNAYVRMRSRIWQVLIEQLYSFEQKNYWPVEKVISPEVLAKQYILPRRQLLDTKLDKLLYNLKSHKLIERYLMPEGEQVGTLEIWTRYEDIAGYFDKIICKINSHPYFHQFSFMETEREPLSGTPLDEKRQYIRDNTLVVDEEIVDFPVKNTEEGSIVPLLEKALNTLLDENKDGVRIISGINGGSPVEDTGNVKGKWKTAAVRFAYRNEATKECLLKEGNALEAYVYHTIWENALVDDVKLNVSFVWDADEDSDALKCDAVTNEIDLVCTKDMQTYFISCKQSLPKTEHLQEIKFFADYFGVDGKAIVICSNWSTSDRMKKEKGIKSVQLITARSRKMDVYYIDRSMIGDFSADMKSGKFVKYIQNILDGKQDWDVID